MLLQSLHHFSCEIFVNFAVKKLCKEENDEFFLKGGGAYCMFEISPEVHGANLLQLLLIGAKHGIRVIC